MKLSVFYGFYVWVTHTMFGLELAFMPARKYLLIVTKILSGNIQVDVDNCTPTIL